MYSARFVHSAVLERVAAMYVPLCVAVIARLFYGRRPRVFVSVLLSVMWVAPTLVVLQRMNLAAGWWSFAASKPQFLGMPLELYIGWVILWGAVPLTVFRRLSIMWVAVVMLLVDCIMMPLLHESVHLGSRWLVGEAVALCVVLLPALCIGSWTRDKVHLRWRGLFQIAIAGLLFLYLVPEIAFASLMGREWRPLWESSLWMVELGVQLVLLLAVPGISAVLEFVERGEGTPIPYDPPKRLVTSGMYRYLANPMQASCAIVMVVWSALLQNAWVFAAGMIALVYSVGLAEWDEREDLEERFGEAWHAYRSEVKNWWPRWRPYYSEPYAVVYIARGCEPCSAVRRWIEARHPLGLEIRDAETLPAGSIRRMRYDPMDGSDSVEGIRAMGRVCEHLNFGWAFAGAALRLPVVWRLVQLVMDACGFGPKTVVTDQCSLPSGVFKNVRGVHDV